MSISKHNVENIYPLTPMQQGMLFHALLEPDSPAYFEQLSWRVHGNLDADIFESSWNVLIKRHAILRTLFAHEGTDNPLQVVLRSRPIVLNRVDLRGSNVEQGVFAYKAADRAQPFVLSRDPLLRVAVLRLSDDDFELVWSHHHIILDGWSVGLALAELLDIYRLMRAGEPVALPVVTPFARFVKWLQARDHEASADFWTERVRDCTERITVPHTRIGRVSSGGAERGAISFGLGAPVTAGLKALAAKRGVTLAVVLNSIWAVLLGRYADVCDVVFGSVVSGRTPDIPGVDRIIGNFINTIPVRARLDRAVTFDELLTSMQRDAAEADPHQHFALNRVQSAHRVEDGLFGTLVSIANYPVDPRLSGDTGLADLGFVVDAVAHIEQTHYDLDVQFVPAVELQVRITYATRLYDAAQIEAIEGHLRAVVAAVITRAGVRLDEIDLLTAAESAAMLCDTGQDASRTPYDTLTAAFERQAAQTPERIAVIAADGQLTYAQLNRHANQTAHRLRTFAPIEPEATIAVLLGRGTQMAVGLLAVLKAGAAYVPLDPSLPRDRVAFIIENAGCKAILASSATIDAACAATHVPVMNMDETCIGAEQNLETGIRPTDLAYVIYTSGSTGRPKGVMIEHHSVINLVDALRAQVYDRYQGPLRVGLLASYSFDASVQQIFAALLLGHALVMVDEETKKDGAALNRFVSEKKLDVIDGTPTLLRIMSRSAGFDVMCRSVRHALIGGEALSWHLVGAVIRPGGMLITNVYGPTECCVDATAQLVSSVPEHTGTTVPVGHPLPNIQVLVVGRTGHLAPYGARGEICIAGSSVGRGYMNDAALTVSKFVKLSSLGALRVYRTADAGRVLGDGAIDCLGRLDDQVKVRGFRIEIGEVEHRLSAHPDVEQAAVFVARGDDTSDELRASLVLSRQVHVEDLRAYLGETLPEHMIPSRFFRVAALPRTDSGKLDRKQLAASEAGALEVGADYAAASSDVERMLVETWQAALGVPRIGIDDSYFSLGGDSIKAIQIVSRLAHHQLRLEIRDLFRHRTIRSLAPLVLPAHSVVMKRSGESAAGPAALTAAQARFFAEHGAEPGRFHHAVLFDASERLDPRIVAQAFASVRDQHEGLRLAFGPVPQAIPGGAPNPEVRLVTDLAAALPEMLAAFDLAAGSLYRLAVVRMIDKDQLLIVVHHLCTDGVSWRVLAEDLCAALSAASTGIVPALPASSDGALVVASRMADYGRSEAARSQLDYWQGVEVRAVPLVEPAGAPRARYRDRATLSLELDPTATSAVLLEANRAYGTTAEDLLLTALARALHARFDADTTGLLLESHGRLPILADVDASRSIGWFTSLYPFVLSLQPGRDLGFQVKSMKEAVRAVPDQGMAYGLLRYLGGAPLRLQPQLSFNYLGQMDAGVSSAPLRMSTEAIDGGVSSDAWSLAELELSAVAIAGRLRLMLAFNAQRFELAAMQVLLETWQGELGVIVEHCLLQTHTELTPADLSYSELSVDELEDLFK
jgi:amino acid adenylation domain-containing protein/non-ribosomal peptide synthase protein (TIGR01720 family)